MCIKEVVAAWFPNQELEIEPIKKGNTSETYRVITKGQSWILRKIASTQQAELEYRIANRLKTEGIAPEIICTTSGEKWVQIDGDVYNLQRYIEGGEIQNCDRRSIQIIAESVAKMHRALADIEDAAVGQDRFQVLELWEKSKARHSILEKCLAKTEYVVNDCESTQMHVGKTQLLHLQGQLPELAKLEQDKVQMIHGDLGIWNMIQNENNVYIIDFGEAHMGNPYLDIAAALTSAITYVKEKEQKVCVDIFCETYEKYYGAIDKALLTKAIKLWFVRGMLVMLTIENIEEDKRKCSVCYYHCQMKKFERIL